MLSKPIIQQSSRSCCFADVAISSKGVLNARLHVHVGRRSQSGLCLEAFQRGWASNRRTCGRSTRQLGLKHSCALAEGRQSVLSKAISGSSSCFSKKADHRRAAVGVRPKYEALYTAAPLSQLARSISRSAAALLLALSVSFSQCLLPASASALQTSSYGDLARMHYKRPPVNSALPNSDEAETIAELNRVQPASCSS